MALIKDGWWQDTWWPSRWWQEDYWLEYGAVAAPTPPTPGLAIPLRRRRRKPFPLTYEESMLVAEYLRLKVKQHDKH